MLGFLSNLFSRKPQYPLLTVREMSPSELRIREVNRRVNVAWMHRKAYQQPLYLEVANDSEQ